MLGRKQHGQRMGKLNSELGRELGDTIAAVNADEAGASGLLQDPHLSALVCPVAALHWWRGVWTAAEKPRNLCASGPLLLHSERGWTSQRLQIASGALSLRSPGGRWGCCFLSSARPFQVKPRGAEQVLL